jgi:hypothetical protein
VNGLAFRVAADEHRTLRLGPLTRANRHVGAHLGRRLSLLLGFDLGAFQLDDARLQLTLDEGQRVSLPVARVRPVLRAFLDLFDGSERLRLSPLDAARLSEIPLPRSKDGLRALEAARQRPSLHATRFE